MPRGQRGGSAPGERRGGRQKGTKDKVSRREKMRAECEATGLTPLEYMLKLLRDPVAPLEVRQWAATAAAPFVHPKLQAAVGADGKDRPVNLDISDRSLALRVALILTRAGAESAVVGSSGGDHPARHSAGGGDAVRGSPSPGCTPLSSPIRPNGADGGGGGPREDPEACISTQHPQSEIQSEISKIPTPKVGEEAVLTESVTDDGRRRFRPVKILNSGPGRPGLPDTFKVIREGLTVHQEPDFDKALAWVREKYHLVDGVVGLEDDQPLRPDQRGREPSRPAVRHSYPERKTRND